MEEIYNYKKFCLVQVKAKQKDQPLVDNLAASINGITAPTGTCLKDNYLDKE